MSFEKVPEKLFKEITLFYVILCNKYCVQNKMLKQQFRMSFYEFYRGTSEDSKMLAFRECYGHLHELQSLAPNAKMIASTARSTKLTKETILNILLMEKPFEIQESPNMPNVTDIVKCMQKDSDHDSYFE